MPNIRLAVAAGYTQPIHAVGDAHDLTLLVQPGTDYDDRFRAFDTDTNEWLWVNGWMFTIEATERDEVPDLPVILRRLSAVDAALVAYA